MQSAANDIGAFHNEEKNIGRDVHQKMRSDACLEVARLSKFQWLSRGMPNVACTFWYLTAGFNTMPSDNSPTIAR